jgi:hypothetical protein
MNQRDLLVSSEKVSLFFFIQVGLTLQSSHLYLLCSYQTFFTDFFNLDILPIGENGVLK